VVEMRAMAFQRSSHAVFDCQYHVMWTTKYRKRALRESYIRDYCKEVLGRAATEYGMSIETIEVDEDHVHLHIRIPPQRSVGRAVGILKSISARMMFRRYPSLKRKYWAGQMWSGAYCARTIGDGLTAANVRRYILAHAESGLEPAQGALFPEETGRRR
jgi:putative transposase